MANLLGDMSVSWDFTFKDNKALGLQEKSQETDRCLSCELRYETRSALLSSKQSTCHSLAVPAQPTESLLLSEVSALEQSASVQLQTHAVEIRLAVYIQLNIEIHTADTYNLSEGELPRREHVLVRLR